MPFNEVNITIDGFQVSMGVSVYDVPADVITVLWDFGGVLN